MFAKAWRQTRPSSPRAARQASACISPTSVPDVSSSSHSMGPKMSHAEDTVEAAGRKEMMAAEHRAEHECSSSSVMKPVADRRSYEFMTTCGDIEPDGVRFLLVSDPEAVFAAACLNMQAGYFDDPPDVAGFAHLLEHAVHLGSERYPDDKDYKYYLSQHGGTSNASTGMVHTSYHFTVAFPHLGPALDRLARFFIDPLLHRHCCILKEAENVHAEFSRNCNSDSRKLLQLRRSAAGGLLAKFSTGNAATLLERPAAMGLDVPAALAAFWRQRYLAGALCGCVVGPQPLSELRALVQEAFAEVRLREEDDPRVGAAPPQEQQPRTAPSLASASMSSEHGKRTEEALMRAWEGAVATTPAVVEQMAELKPQEGAPPRVRTVATTVRYNFGDMCPPWRLGRLFRVASQRQLRQMEIVWYLPYGVNNDIRSKPWRWAGHVMGHEGRGSLAALLRGAGLVQELTTGLFDEVRLGRGFMFWGLTITLSEVGLPRSEDVLRLAFAAVRAMRSLDEGQRHSVWEEVAAAAAVRWQYQDRTAPLDLARDAAQRLHYFEAESVLSGNALLYEYDAAALERFLSYITPQNCNVYLSDSSFAGRTNQVEPWYGARYSEEPLNLELYDSDAAPAAADAAAISCAAAGVTATAGAAAADVDAAGAPDDPYPLLLSRLRLPQPPSWALPVDVRLVSEAAAATAVANEEPVSGVDDASGLPASEGLHQGMAVEEVEAVPEMGAVEEVEAAADASAATLAAAGKIRTLDVALSARCQQPRQAVTAVAAAAVALGGRRSGFPHLLEDSGAVRLWHMTDTSFGVPKTHVYVHLITRAVYDTPATWVTARLACRLMEELLQPDVYDAQLVGTSYSLAASETGLHLSFHGFSGMVKKLVEVVVASLSGLTPQQVDARYDLVHGKLLRSLRLWRHNNPAAHAEYGTEHVLQLPHWHVEESLQVLESAAAAAAAPPPRAKSSDTLEAATRTSEEDATAAAAAAVLMEAAAAAAASPRAVWEFLRFLGRGMALEVLVYGNSTAQDAQELCATLVRHLRPSGLGPDGWPATRILDLAPQPAAASRYKIQHPRQQHPHQQQQEEEMADEAGFGLCTTSPASPTTMEAEPQPPRQEAAGERDGEREGTARQLRAGGEAACGDRGDGDEDSGRGGGGGEELSGRPVLLRYVPSNPNPANTNSAVFFLCQVGEDDPQDIRPAVLLDLLTRVACKAAFHELRTRQRLGYAVSLVKHRLGGGMGLAVRVQSPDRRPGLLRRRVAEWLAGFGRELRDLAPERLASFKASVEEKYLEAPRSLAEAAEAVWRPIRYRSYDFWKAERKAVALRDVGLQDLVRFYEQYVCPTSLTARILCCEICGGAAAAAATAAARAGRPGDGDGRGRPCPDSDPGPGTAGGGDKGSCRRRGGPVVAVGSKDEDEDEGEGASEGGMLWQRIGSEGLAELHQRLPHFCHSETLQVLRPLELATHGSLAGSPTAASAADHDGKGDNGGPGAV